MRRIGVLMTIAEDDPESKARVAVFEQSLQRLGWSIGQNMRIDYRWSGGKADVARKYAADLLALAPTSSWPIPLKPSHRCWKQPTLSPSYSRLLLTPLVPAMSRACLAPGETPLASPALITPSQANGLELLKEIAPGVKRVAVLRETATAAGPAQFGAIQSVAPSFGVELRPISMGKADEIERAITAFAESSNGGLIVTGSVEAAVHRGLIVSLAARHRLPAVYFARYVVTAAAWFRWA